MAIPQQSTTTGAKTFQAHSKVLPVVGLVFIYSDINDKGVVNGVCNNLLDACPILGWVKFGTECFWGDWLPNKD